MVYYLFQCAGRIALEHVEQYDNDCRHSAQTVVEVLMFATARQMVVEHMAPTQTLIGVIAIAVLFAIRKFLMTEDSDMSHSPFKKCKEEKHEV